MSRLSIPTVTMIVAGLAVGAGSLVAGPILFDPDVSDELRCLARLKSLSIALAPDSQLPREVSGDELLALVTSAVADHGIQVHEGRGPPRMLLHHLLARDPDAEGTVALTVSLAVYQRVRLHRLAIDMTLPVGTVTTNAIGREADLAALYKKQTKATVEDFLYFVAAADAHVKPAGDGEQ